MAPVAPSKRKTLRLKATERLANPLAPRKVHRPDAVVDDTFLDSKRDKRLIKHSAFVSKIAHPKSSSGISKAARKNAKRHDKKKLQTNLESLADALPELTNDEVRGGEAEKDGRVRHKSLRSKPGALKKKDRVVRGEMERFGRSLAQLSTVREIAAAERNTTINTTGTDTKAHATTTMMEDVVENTANAPPQSSCAANRFAALRGFIAATMEQNPAFANKSAIGSKGS